MTDKLPSDAEKLSENWGHQPISLDHPWIETQRLPAEIDHFESMFRELPENNLYVRLAGNSAGAGDPSRTILDGTISLEERLRSENLHVLGVNLNLVSGELQEFLDRFMDFITPVLQHNGITEKPEASLAAFVSCANCIVPFHADPEHNFLFQIRGAKKFHIYPNNDFELFPSIYRERLIKTKKCVLPYEDHWQNRAFTMNLQPGSSTYQPPMAPHWVESDESINISYAVSVFTSKEQRTRRILLVNDRLRSLRMRPSDIGKNQWNDSLKDRISLLLKKGVGPHFG